MKKQYFGTDGIRGEVGHFPIVPEFMTRLGYAAGKVLTKEAKPGERTGLILRWWKNQNAARCYSPSGIHDC